MAAELSRFTSSHFSLNRALTHLDAFDKLRYEYLSSIPFVQYEEIDSKADEKIIKVKLVKLLPDELSGLAHDAVNNLRAALDQAIYPFNGGRDAVFPFGSDANTFENSLKGRTKNLPAEIVEVIRSCKPYRGGDDVLYALNRLDNTRKHAIICPVAVAIPSTTVSGTATGGFSMPPPRWDREKNEMVLCRMKPGGRVRFRFDFNGYVVMTGVDIIDGSPASGTLRQFAQIVKDILQRIELEATTHNLL